MSQSHECCYKSFETGAFLTTNEIYYNWRVAETDLQRISINGVQLTVCKKIKKEYCFECGRISYS